MTVELRFFELVENNNSPIVIRFIPIPELDLEWGNIGTEVSTDYHADIVEINYDVTWYVARVETEIAAAFGGYTRVEQVHDLLWKDLGYCAQDIHLGYRIGPLATQEISPKWGVTASYTIETVVTWRLPPVYEINHTVSWTDNKTKHETFTATSYKNIPDLVVIENDVIYRSGADQREKEYLLQYGPHLPRWICSTNYRPPIGSVTMRFVGEIASGPIVLRFIPSPEYCYYDDGGGLIDAGGDLPNLDLNIPIEPQIRRVYLMQPELVVTRVSDNLPIVVTSVSISDNRGQFTSSGSIEFSSRGDALNAINQLLLVQINGYDFYLLPEEISRNQSFGQSQFSASCRSRTAQLAAPLRAPISYSNTVDRSVAGIMGDILTASGWSVELVGFLDFNIPAGVFSITGKAPIESVNEIADMIGCIVIPNEFSSVLRIVPRWPVTPWNFATAVPSIAVHDAVIISYSSRDEFNQLCDSCWVRGEQQGVSRHVKRTGTAGNIPTSDVSNALIVTDTAARLVGTAKIADTGRKERVTISLPVMVDLPPLVKGMLIGVNYFGEIYKATCDSVSISASVNSDGDIDVTQTANLIRHME
jgi:hypothetical protein